MEYMERCSSRYLRIRPKTQNSRLKTKNQNLRFFEKVYKVVRKVPTGRVATYGQISTIFNSFSGKITPRTVGFALHANKDPKVPCHRVVNKDGRVALNYRFGGWRKQKMKLLAEGVTFKDKLCVDLEKHLWSAKVKI